MEAAAAEAPSAMLRLTDPRGFVNKFSTFLLDCDGKHLRLVFRLCCAYRRQTSDGVHRCAVVWLHAVAQGQGSHTHAQDHGIPFPHVIGVRREWLIHKKQGKQVVYLTNNSTKSRAMYLEKLTSFGIEATEVPLSHLLSRL